MTDQMPDQAQAAVGGRSTTDAGWFLYGLLLTGADIEPDARGIGDPPAVVETIPVQDVSALVSRVPIDRPIGTPADLRAFKQLLDGIATRSAVLPAHFGTTLDSRDAVAQLVEARHDEYRSLLNELDGRVEYLVRARYVEQVLLGEIISENAEAAQLRDAIRDQPPELTMDHRMRLGEIVNYAIEAKRSADTQRLVDVLTPVSAARVARPPAHEEEAANVAFLIDADRQDEFEHELADLAKTWQDRATVRLLGPLAPWDFTGRPQSAQAA